MVAPAGGDPVAALVPPLRFSEVVMNLRVSSAFGPLPRISIKPHDFFMRTLLYHPW
jgi:hypothetical protein